MKIISTVFKKELLEIFRDKKTVIAGILIPLLMYPILFTFMGKAAGDENKEIETNIKITIVDKSKSKLSDFIKSQPNIKVVESENIKEDVKEGSILLALEIPKDFEENILKEKTGNIEITYDDASRKSDMAKSEINRYIREYSQQIVAERLGKRNVDTSLLTPVNIIEKTPEKEKSGLGRYLISLLLPMILVMFSAFGPLASATDLGAGEKERGTLEPLLTTQANRMSLLWGKFLAITVMGGITAAAAITGIFISMNMDNGLFGEGGIALDINLLLIIGVMTILTTMVFAALELSISIYAKSSKEAQTYLMPVSMIGMIGAFSAYLIDAKHVSMMYLNIPIINVTSIIKELTVGIFNLTHIAIVFGWIVVYIVASIAFARYMFSKEEVIFRT